MRKKYRKEFDYTNVNDVSDVMQDLREIEDKYPKVMAFLEWYCGFTRPTSGRVAEEICYDQGKRDVILIIKTLQRTDIDPAVVVNEFKRNREGEF